MHRPVILDFLSTYRLQLNMHKFKFATISLMGRFNLKEVSNLVLRADEIQTYHVNEPRIYEKSYSFELFSKTICDMCVYTKDVICLKKENVSNILDPFYLKDISKLDFVSLCMFPIIKNEEVVGTVIFYFDSTVNDFSCKQSDLVKLFDNLQTVMGLNIENSVKNAIYDSEEFIKIIYLKDESKCYIDSYLKNKFHQKSYILDLSDNFLKRKLDREIKNNKYRKTLTKDFIIYYANKYEYQNNDTHLDTLSILALNKIDVDEFSIIFSDVDDLTKELLQEFSDVCIKKIFIQNSFYAYLVYCIIPNRTSEEIKNRHLDKYLLTVTSKQITSKMKLDTLANYLCENRPDSFNFKDYVMFLNSLNSIELSSDVLVSSYSDKTFVNSLNNTCYGILPSICTYDINTETKKEVYVKSIYKFIKGLIKESKSGYIIPVIPSMFSNKKIFQALESLQNIDKELKVFVFIPSIDKTNIDLLEKGISKLRTKGMYVIVDSSIYFNNFTLYLLDLANSIYIHNDEYLMLVKYPSGINTAIYQYIIKNYKEILIDCDIKKANDAYFNSLIYYVK